MADLNLTGEEPGSFSGGSLGNPGDKIANDHAVQKQEGGFATDVEGVMADGEKEGHPVFDVSPDEFYANMKQDRRRLRFKADTNAQKYFSGTKYSRPFFIRNAQDGYMRKVK